MLFCSKPMLLSWSLTASSEQASVALVVVISHRNLKLKISKILKLSSWRSILAKLLSSFVAASSIWSMRLVFSKLLSWVAATSCPFCIELSSSSWLWEAPFAEGFFFFFFFFFFFLFCCFAPFAVGKAVPKDVVFLCCLRLSQEKLQVAPPWIQRHVANKLLWSSILLSSILLIE